MNLTSTAQTRTDAAILPLANPAPASKPEPARDGVMVVNGASMHPQPVNWLWDGYFARGKMTLLAGEPGTGKTTIAMSIGATVTRGGAWPDGTVAEAGNVIIWSGEDDPRDTLTPRLMAAGADMSRVYFITGTRIEGKVKSFDPARDMPALKDACEKIGNVRLLIVDPIVSAVTGDSHKNTETRRALQPLVDLAANVGAALLGITHFNKGKAGSNPAQWVNGSVAFTAVARVVLIAAKVKRGSGEDIRVFARAKSNIGPDDGGFEYQIEQCEPTAGIPSSCISWGNEVTGSAHELLGNQEKNEGRGGSAVSSAREFLAELLNGGDMPAKAIEADAEQAGIALRTLRRASDALRVAKYKGKDGKWYWSLSESANTANVSNME
ncbi:AAA family ATPase [Burkholderia vietnamiensis]|uniref:AAA family ATPase n=1 Tax=Burkholderia vietnamiensis TaxID=60552 RepID=UPI001CAE0C9A|nr:AAA family ATPase [Burkholderia vietnamiensis]CAG9228479.1 Putative TOPRIM domain protein [Burkholderia vietnamiensis]